jgi:LysM repeat protein
MSTNITWQDLYGLNPQLRSGNPNLIYPGEVLTMPDGSSYTIVKGDTLSGIAARWNKTHVTTVSETEDPGIQTNHGLPYDDDGNLMPGWTLDEENNPVWVGGDFRESAIVAQNNKDKKDDADNPAPATPINKVNQQSTSATPPDWRFRITLAPNAKYFYNLSSEEAGILAPLKSTNGVIFPYTPTVSVNYSANYDATTLTHSNFKIYNYQSSAVESISVTGEFTAQDAAEANYMLAVIHFFRSATKMFYGKDANPSRGVPPPLLFMSGFGQYQFDNHPVALQSFTYTLPTDVDYINAYPNAPSGAGVNGAQLRSFDLLGGLKAGPIRSFIEGAANRLLGSGLKLGGAQVGPPNNRPPTASTELTRVPTKISLSMTFIPMVNRYAISNEFSLKDYASGKLLRGSQNPKAGGGIW